MQWLRTRLDRFDLALIALTVISFAAVAVLPMRPNKFGDLNFHLETKALARAVQGAGAWNEVIIEKAPGPVFYYVTPYVLVPPGSDDDRYWRAAFAWTIGWMTLCALLLRRTGQILGGPVVSFVAPLLTLAAPFAVYYSYGVNAEPSAYLAATVFIYGWARWRSGHAGGRWLACAGAFGFVLSRPNGLLIVPVALAAAGLLWRLKPADYLRHVRFALAVSAAIVVAIAASSLIVTLVRGKRQVPYLAHVVFHGSFQYRTEPLDWRHWSNETRPDSRDYALWRDEWARLKQEAAAGQTTLSTLQWKWIIDDHLHHPFLRLKMAAIRLVTMHTPFISSGRPERFRVGPIGGKYVFAAFQSITVGLNLFVAISALWAIVRNRSHFLVLWPLWGLWCALLAFHVFTYAESRYLLPAQPGMFVLAAMALAPAVVRAGGRPSDIPPRSPGPVLPDSPRR